MITVANFSAFSYAGHRPNQEDYIITPTGTNERIFVLCDGVGGHGHGEVASKTIAESVYSYLKELNAEEYTPENLQDAVDYASDILADKNTFDDEKSMGTTIVVVVINRMSILIGHIGDSRCYQFDKDCGIKFRTKDHSKVQEAIDAEILTEDEAWNHPRKNIITRCVMAGKGHTKLDVTTIEVEDGDMLLICSDGLTDALKDKQIQAVFVERTLDEVSEVLKTECEIKSRDNYSVILLSLAQDEVNPPKEVNTPSIEPLPVADVKPIKTKCCIYCGSKISLTSQFCPYCGKSVAEKLHQPPLPSADDKCKFSLDSVDLQSVFKKYSPIIYIAGGIAIGLLAAWVGGMFSSDTDSNSHTIVTPLSSKADTTTQGFYEDINVKCVVKDSLITDSIIGEDSLLQKSQEILKNMSIKDTAQ